MKKQVTRVSPQQTSKVLALVYFFSSLPFVLFMSLSAALSRKSDDAFPVFLFILMPLLYLIFGYLLTLYGAWIYNHIAKRIGGIELTVMDVDGDRIDNSVAKPPETPQV